MRAMLRNKIEKSEELSIAAMQSNEEGEYWVKTLSGELPKSGFPRYLNKTGPKSTDVSREDHRRELEFQSPIEVTSKILKLSNQSDRRLYIILTAALAVLIDKYTGNKDIIIGMPVEKQEIEGDFVNTVLAVRNRLEENTAFKGLLLQTREIILEAIKHQNYPMEMLLYELGFAPDEKEFPLFDVAILLENIHEKKYLSHINLNMIFVINRRAGHIEGRVEYNSQFYDKTFVMGIIRHFFILLQKAASDINIPIKKICILAEEDREQLLYGFNNRKTPPVDNKTRAPKVKTIQGLFEEAVERNGDHIALVHGNTQLSYKQLNEKANQFAHTLRAKGVKPNTCVGMIVGRSLEMIVGMLGILKAGGVYLPIDPGYPPERIEYMLKDSGVILLVSDNNQAEGIDFKGEWLRIDLENKHMENIPDPENSRNANDCAYVIYTSGSTGKPKGVVVQHNSIANTLHWRKHYYNFNQTDISLQLTSYSFDSSVDDIFTPLISSSKMIMLRNENPLEIAYLSKIITRALVTHFIIVPSLYKTLLEEMPEGLKYLKKITVAGDDFTKALVKEHFDKLNNVRVYNEYGPTENSVCSTVYEFTPSRTQVLIGKPINNVNCYILNINLELLPIGVPGQLFLSGAGLARGYLGRPELTAQRFRRNPFEPGKRIYETGDLARWWLDGDIEFLGRVDDQVKIRGYRIEVGEIVNILLKYQDVKEAIVTAMEDKNGDKYLCAYIVLAKPIEISEVKSMLLKNLPDYMIPRYFVPIDNIPLTPHGKVDRKSLPQPETGISLKEYTPPTDEVEENLVRIWSEVLGIEKEKIGTEHNFFELGGHSLNLVKLISNIYKKFAVEISINQIFQQPIIKEISKYVKSTRSVEEPMVLLNQPTQNKLFCFPPGLPYGIAYKDLASIITDYSFYSFSFIEDEDRLKKYVDIITGLQSEGPYVLFGYSAAGKLIFEVTKALENHGGQVSDIVLFDSFMTEENEDEEKIFEEHRAFIEMTEKNMEELGIGFLKEKVKKKMKEYLIYNRSLTQLEVIHANVHLIISEEKRETDMSGCWDKYTTKSTMIYQGCGQHRDMFLPGYLERNAEITRKILYKIPLKKRKGHLDSYS